MTETNKPAVGIIGYADVAEFLIFFIFVTTILHCLIHDFPKAINQYYNNQTVKYMEKIENEKLVIVIDYAVTGGPIFCCCPKISNKEFIRKAPGWWCEGICAYRYDNKNPFRIVRKCWLIYCCTCLCPKQVDKDKLMKYISTPPCVTPPIGIEDIDKMVEVKAPTPEEVIEEKEDSSVGTPPEDPFTDRKIKFSDLLKKKKENYAGDILKGSIFNMINQPEEEDEFAALFDKDKKDQTPKGKMMEWMSTLGGVTKEKTEESEKEDEEISKKIFKVDDNYDLDKFINDGDQNLNGIGKKLNGAKVANKIANIGKVAKKSEFAKVVEEDNKKKSIGGIEDGGMGLFKNVVNKNKEQFVESVEKRANTGGNIKKSDSDGANLYKMIADDDSYRKSVIAPAPKRMSTFVGDGKKSVINPPPVSKKSGFGGLADMVNDELNKSEEKKPAIVKSAPAPAPKRGPSLAGMINIDELSK